jgi:hypothetical protein
VPNCRNFCQARGGHETCRHHREVAGLSWGLGVRRVEIHPSNSRQTLRRVSGQRIASFLIGNIQKKPIQQRFTISEISQLSWCGSQKLFHPAAKVYSTIEKAELDFARYEDRSLKEMPPITHSQCLHEGCRPAANQSPYCCTTTVGY